MGREFELKYVATEQVQDAIAEKLGGFTDVKMETHYFDTPDGALQQRKITLRRRWENAVAVCTVKTPGQGYARGEWQTEDQEMETAILKLCKLGAPEELYSLTRQGVEEICGARFTRRVRKVQLPDCTVELALDRGVLMGGGRQQPLCEIEVELLSGSEEAACAYASALAEVYDLCPETKSKFRRALDLRKGE